MKKIFAICLILLAVVPAMGQNPKNLRLEYDAYFEYYFENREFDYDNSEYLNSGTINAALLTPSIGFSFAQNKNIQHRLMLGVDLLHDMGKGVQNYQIFDEVTFNYDIHVRTNNGALFEGIVGVFPRRYCEGEYGEFFASDSLKWADRNLEGILLKYKSKNFYAELGEDWMGRFGQTRKERFMIFTAGAWDAKHWLRLGWDASLYHYACSEEAPGVVDMHQLHPYAKFNFAHWTGLQELSLKAGPILTYQWDREREESAEFAGGGEFVLTARKWNVYIQNTLFAQGDDMMRLYDSFDTGGNKYGNNLYFGNPIYRDFFDMVHIGWEPYVADYLRIKLGVRLNWNADGFMGAQQFFGCSFNLDKVRHPRVGSGRIGNLGRKPKAKKEEIIIVL